jgi:SAM-dependent methyltransferase
MSSREGEDLNKQAIAIWDQNADWWDERAGDDQLPLQRLTIGPATERLLNLQPGEIVLDVACGNGGFSRRMAQLGCHVIAIDASERFLARARGRSAHYGDQIEYRLVDATDKAQLLAHGEHRFDAIVCTMAIMDMAEIDPLMSAVSKLLNPDGRFVFSVTHPCFNSTGIRRSLEEEDLAGEIVDVYSIKVLRYANLAPAKGVGIIGQPAAQIYFDRPINVLLNACFKAGLVMDGIEEPVFSREEKGARPFSWENFKEIPPVFIARMRPMP